MLQAGRGHNVNALAGACGVSRRTIFRDLDTLKKAGVPLQFSGHEQRYRIPQQYFLPPTDFTAEEALAVLVMCHELGDKQRLPLYTAARSAALKLESSLPVRLRDYLRSVTGSVQIHLQQVSPLEGKDAVYQQLVDAISLQRYVRIRYDSIFEGEVIGTRLSPYRLLFSRRSWYVIGRSSLHRSVRTFHVGRILQLEQLEDTFPPPKRFTLERYLRNAWHMIPERGGDHHVRVRFQKQVARNVAEVLWHKTQRCEMAEDGSLEFRATVTGLKEISWWILGYGDQAEVLEPTALRNIVAGKAEAMLRKYRPATLHSERALAHFTPLG